MDRCAYVALLAAFHGFIAPWEAALARALPSTLHEAFEARRKSAWLEADLHVLGASLGTRRAAVPVPDSLPGQIGAWYVVEGSTLGGRIIAPALAAHFGFAPRQGNAYFDAYGADTGSRWRSFRMLAEAEVGPSDIEACVAGARLTFEALDAWFAACGIDAACCAGAET